MSGTSRKGKTKRNRDNDKPKDTDMVSVTRSEMIRSNMVDFDQFELRLECNMFPGVANELMTVKEFVHNIYNSDVHFKPAVKLPPENDKEGPVEYKLKLIDPDKDNIVSKTTQMKFRLGEGDGECYYRVGYMDNGVATGLHRDDILLSMRRVKLIRLPLLYGISAETQNDRD